MKTIKIPYYKETIDIHVAEENLKAVITAKMHEYKAEKGEKELVEDALANPIGSKKLSELAVGKNKIVIVTSDHTRAVPSKLTLPILLKEIRSGNPDADITILIAMERYGIAFVREDFAWNECVDAARLEAVIAAHPEITTISIVHNETTSGLINDLVSVSEVVKNHNLRFILDAMSSFGAVDVNVAELGIDFLISSANKCIQGVPGFSFIIARREALTATEGNARTISLDLHSQWKTMEKDNGKWRFTSPTHVVAAFAQALKELQQERPVPKVSY